MSHFDVSFEDLPASVPIFPLTGVLLLPRGMLPLNIFEPRYLNMVKDALAGDRLIAMAQPCQKSAAVKGDPPVYPICCAGRITAFEETDDGRILISLKGLCRFRISEELATTRGYRRVMADWQDFEADLQEDAGDGVDRDALFKSLKAYFTAQGIQASWDALCGTPNERLINSLAMICPFAPPEKQALLEATSLADRARVLTTLVEMAVLDTSGDGSEKSKQ
jgi:uncharacterized protein